MKRFATGAIFGALIAISLASYAVIGGFLRSHQHSSATDGGGSLNLSGTLGSTRACAANYVTGIKALIVYVQLINTANRAPKRLANRSRSCGPDCSKRQSERAVLRQSFSAIRGYYD